MAGRDEYYLPYVLGVRTGIILGHSNKSKIAVESDGTAFLLYCALVFGL